jgi:hypothetical protein
VVLVAQAVVVQVRLLALVLLELQILAVVAVHQMTLAQSPLQAVQVLSFFRIQADAQLQSAQV